ncbi:MAG: DUF1667 domain-containing protein [Clostridia bacterium]|nr:DUF1667 domain-containing protein [Clostridia bacterium]
MKLTCIECPMGCEIEVVVTDGVVSVSGNGCPRGKLYAQNETVCPRRVLTTTVMTEKGIPVSVKTDKPVKKSEMQDLMQKINKITVCTPVKIGQIIENNLTEDINLVATSTLNK